ncbi:unnamed protein product, partial [Mesorhabditis spiculigera]
MAQATTLCQPSTSLQLTVSAKNLKNRDLLSKSDPQCIFFQQEGRLSGRPEWKEKGRTEKIDNCLSPEFNKRLNIDYFFEERQFLRFELYDLDSNVADLSQHDFLGRFDCELAEIVSAVDGVLTGNLTGLRGKCGTITISSEEMEDGAKEIVQFNLSGRHLDKKDLFGKSDPFLNIYRMRGDGSRQLAHRTEVIKKTLNPDWKVFDVNSKLLCGGDRNAPILIDCYDHDFDGGHDYIGSCQTTLERLLSRQDKELPLISEKKKAKKGAKYKDSGALLFNAVHIYRENSFLDFIHGGTQLDFALAIDFTASNGPVHDPTSLHYLNPAIPNQYEVALRACLDICQHYNHSKRFDAFGFGAKVPPNERVSPIFNLNFQQHPSVVGVNGVMSAYRHSLNQVRLYGPTNFSPVIEEVARHAAAIPRDGSRYQVLLIITDGAISDMAKTKAAIVSASSLPLSIIIVGVGNEQFEAMDELDSDNVMLSHAGRFAARDIVQFVPIRNFLSPHAGQNPLEADRAMGLLAKEVLAEVPGQVTGYMKMHKIQPRPTDNPFPRDAPAEELAPAYPAMPNAAAPGGQPGAPYPPPGPPSGGQHAAAPYPQQGPPPPSWGHQQSFDAHATQAAPYPQYPQYPPQYPQQPNSWQPPNYPPQQSYPGAPPPSGHPPYSTQQPPYTPPPQYNASAPPVDALNQMHINR